jgi:hypothetical protein
MGKAVVRLTPNCWLAPWRGDPGRTMVRESAKVYESPWAAFYALVRAKTFRPFPQAVIEDYQPAEPETGSQKGTEE